MRIKRKFFTSVGESPSEEVRHLIIKERKERYPQWCG